MEADAADPVAAYLAEAREGFECGLDPRTGPNIGLCRANAERGSALLGAVEAVLKRHQPGHLVLVGKLCGKHEAHRHFSITRTEADDVRACPDCTGGVFTSCTGCAFGASFDHCPDRLAISSALLGKEGQR